MDAQVLWRKSEMRTLHLHRLLPTTRTSAKEDTRTPKALGQELPRERERAADGGAHRQGGAARDGLEDLPGGEHHALRRAQERSVLAERRWSAWAGADRSHTG